MTLAPGAATLPTRPRQVVTALVDEATVEAIATEARIALVGEDELLVPVPGYLPADTLSAWVDVVGGNVKAALPGPSTLGLPEVGPAPAVRDPGDVCRIDVLWRGRSPVVSVQGAPPALPVPQENPHENPHENGAPQ